MGHAPKNRLLFAPDGKPEAYAAAPGPGESQNGAVEMLLHLALQSLEFHYRLGQIRLAAEIPDAVAPTTRRAPLRRLQRL
jgi:hypothetical protein